jgi:hypothetical protein
MAVPHQEAEEDVFCRQPIEPEVVLHIAHLEAEFMGETTEYLPLAPVLLLLLAVEPPLAPSHPSA